MADQDWNSALLMSSSMFFHGEDRISFQSLFFFPATPFQTVEELKAHKEKL